MKNSIKNFSKYFITSNGKIINQTSNKELSIQKCRAGYSRAYLTNDEGKRKGLSVHRLIAESFIPNPDNKPCVNHIDGNKSNNEIKNLEWCTHKENTQYAINELGVKLGVAPKELRNNMVVELNESFTTDEISKVFGISQPRVMQILAKYKNA